MHILMTTDAVGGVWGYTLQLAGGLAAHGVRVTLVSVGREPGATQRAALLALPNLQGYHHLPYKLEWQQDSLTDVLAARGALTELAARLRPDVLHSNQFCFGDLPTACPRLVVAHSDIMGWQRWCEDTPSSDAAWQSFVADYRWLVQAGLHGADAIVAPSQFVADGLGGDYGLDKLRIRVIPNGVTLPPRFAVKRNVALTVGRLWDKAKNIGLVLAAVQQQGEGLPLRVLVAGEDEQHGYKGITHIAAGITYLGALPAVMLYQQYARASVYIAASRYEPFGLAAVEAALHGCAIIANDIPTFRELWGDDALYFRRNDATSLYSMLADLLSDTNKAAAYGARAHLRALHLYNAARMAADYFALYHRMMRHSEADASWAHEGALIADVV